MEYAFDRKRISTCYKGLRMKNRDELSIINGNGLYGEGEIIDSNPKKTKVKIHELKKIKKPVPLTLAFCPTKNNDRNKLIIVKATEIGVTDFFPIISQNSENRKWNTERFEKVLISILNSHKGFGYQQFILSKNLTTLLKKTLKLKFLAHCKKKDKNSIKKFQTL